VTFVALPPSKHGQAINRSVCRSCREPILWVVTPQGRRMPVDPATDESHFASCKDSDAWRKQRRNTKET
jgi:hypothetical protein